MSAPMNEQQISEEIKKIRKKLKQIANLERKEHSLTHKEKNKINKKSGLRKELFSLLPATERELEESPVTTKVKNVNKKVKPKQNVGEKKSKVKDSESKISAKSSVINSTENQDNESDEADKTSDIEQMMSEDEEESEGEVTEFVPSSQSTQLTYNTDEQEVLKNKNTNSQINTANTQSVPLQPKPTPVRNPLKERWQKVECIIEELEGHNDIITSLQITDNYLVTASRDTTVKIWDIETGVLVRSLGGHTETITTVIIVQDNSLIEALEVEMNDKIVISGSTDCSFKLWSLLTGRLIKSVYTYNPITSLVYSLNTNLLVTASGGGKIELWDLKSSENINSIRNDEDAITCVTVENDLVYSSSDDGIIKVYEIRDRKLCCLFESDDLDLINRQIRCIISNNHTLYYGDDGINIKAVNWKKRSVTKYPNHTEEFASTDAISIKDNLLLTSSYNLDHGYGYLNVRELPSCEYQFSLINKHIDRIICLACTRLNNGDIIIVTGGSQLHIWRIGPKSRFATDHRTKCKLRFIEKLSRKGHDSDNEESDDDENEDDFEHDVEHDDDDDELSNRNCNKPDEEGKSWSWCEIL